MQSIIKDILSASLEVKRALIEDDVCVATIERVAREMIRALKAGGTIYSCGNGGSTCDAMHLTEELVARFKRERPGLRAIHFMDPSVLTCWSNDYDFSTVFERQVQTFCTGKDILMAFSSSGMSANVLKAVAAAKEIGTTTVGISGKGGGDLKDACDISLVVPASATERVQEGHITIVHILCELIERELGYA